MNARKREECNCIICGKLFYPSSKMSGKYCSRKCADIGRVKSKYEEYLQNPTLYNCHSLTENFGSRNKNANSGRSVYYGRATAD